MYYTYAYLRKNGTPYYIGKGKGQRINQYHKRTGNKSIPLPELKRRIKLKQNLTEEEAFKYEKYMIFVFGRKDLGTGVLLNMNDGGGGSGAKGEKNYFYGKSQYGGWNKGISPSEEVKKKIKQSHCSWFIFEHKDGRKLKLFTTLKSFCEEYGLDRRTMQRVMNREPKYKQHKGWIVSKFKS
jgi:hypothetical protein